MTDGTRLLDLTQPGNSLVASSRWVTSTTWKLGQVPDLPALSCQRDTIITPDGSAVICAAVATFNERATPQGLRRDARVAFLKYSTATGKPLGVVGEWTIKNAGALAISVLWTNASGSVLIGTIPDTANGRVGIVSKGTFSPLPLPGWCYAVW